MSNKRMDDLGKEMRMRQELREIEITLSLCPLEMYLWLAWRPRMCGWRESIWLRMRVCWHFKDAAAFFLNSSGDKTCEITHIAYNCNQTRKEPTSHEGGNYYINRLKRLEIKRVLATWFQLCPTQMIRQQLQAIVSLDEWNLERHIRSVTWQSKT